MSEVVVEDLHKEYHTGEGRLDILKGVSLSIKKGERLGIVGASGAGKSTFLHILGGLDKPTSGRVLYDGTDIFQQSDTKLANFRNEKVGFVFQFHHLLPEFSALENVMMPSLIARKSKGQAREQASKLLETVGLSKRMTHKPGELSGGEQQRVAIARAMANSPEVILADEPTGNLDTQTGKKVFQSMLDLHDQTGCTLVFITHNEALTEGVERAIRLEDGNIVE